MINKLTMVLLALSTCVSTYADTTSGLTINSVSRVNKDHGKKIPVDGFCKPELGKVAISINDLGAANAECISDSSGRGVWVDSLYIGNASDGQNLIYVSQGDNVSTKEIFIDRRAPHLDLTSRYEISQENLASFVIGGNCSESDSDIRLILTDEPIRSILFETSVICNQGLWSRTLDLTPYAEKLKTMTKVKVVLIQTDLNGNRTEHFDETVTTLR